MEMVRHATTPARVAYALQRAGEPLARRRASVSSGAVVKQDGPTVVVSFYTAGRTEDEKRVRRRLEKYGRALRTKGFSVTTIPDELALRIL